MNIHDFLLYINKNNIFIQMNVMLLKGTRIACFIKDNDILTTIFILYNYIIILNIIILIFFLLFNYKFIFYYIYLYLNHHIKNYIQLLWAVKISFLVNKCT